MRAKPSFSITMSEELIDRLDEESERMNISRSALVTIAVNTYFEQRKMIKEMPDTLKNMSGVLRDLKEVMDKAEDLKNMENS